MPEHPGTPPAPISVSGTAGPAACGETGMVGSLSGRHSVGANRPDVTVRSRRGLDLLLVCPLCQPSNRRSVPLPPPSDWGQSAEMKPVQSERYGRFASRVEGFRGWRALSAGLTWAVQPLRWWLSGDTGAMWLDRCGEDADRLFFHGLAERLRSANVLNSPVHSRSARGMQ